MMIKKLTLCCSLVLSVLSACTSTTTPKLQGDHCTSNVDCDYKQALVCLNNVCTKSCKTDPDCPANQSCQRNFCAAKSGTLTTSPCKPDLCTNPGKCQVRAGASCDEKGQCVYPTLSCDDNKACTTDTCNLGTGTCVHIDKICLAKASHCLVHADDQKEYCHEYESESREEEGKCVCIDDAKPLQPHSVANCKEACENACASKNCPVTANGNCKTYLYCSLGECIYKNAEVGTKCLLDNGKGGVCSGGACVECMATPDCPTTDPCQQYKCGDSNTCVPDIAKLTCNSPNVCQKANSGRCDPVNGGCGYEPLPSSTPCESDNDQCTKDFCDGGAEASGGVCKLGVRTTCTGNLICDPLDGICKDVQCQKGICGGLCQFTDPFSPGTCLDDSSQTCYSDNECCLCCIGGLYRADLSSNPVNVCQLCNARTSPESWLSASSSTKCTDNKVCTGSVSQPDLCDGNGQCVPGPVDCHNPPSTCYANDGDCHSGGGCIYKQIRNPGENCGASTTCEEYQCALDTKTQLLECISQPINGDCGTGASCVCDGRFNSCFCCTPPDYGCGW